MGGEGVRYKKKMGGGSSDLNDAKRINGPIVPEDIVTREIRLVMIYLMEGGSIYRVRFKTETLKQLMILDLTKDQYLDLVNNIETERRLNRKFEMFRDSVLDGIYYTDLPCNIQKHHRKEDGTKYHHVIINGKNGSWMAFGDWRVFGDLRSNEFLCVHDLLGKRD